MVAAPPVARSVGQSSNNSAASMATVAELKSALREALEARGVLGQLKARIRSEVFRALDDQSEERPPLTHENLLINELIREYLEFNKYRYTASVLIAESGQPEVPLDRRFLASELNVVEEPSAAAVPLLYSLLSHFLSSADSGKLFLRNPPNPQQHPQQANKGDGESL
ncbi:lisH domain-containing protein FOPNL [Astyanax mexicanus]|nr:lisH domain-containing protein FOPNL [Astyanax mexicanus]KAG9277347.1 lisH domain-containing protein FOPNL [Astyanax mexicanus]